MRFNIQEQGAVSIVTVSGEFTMLDDPQKFVDVLKGLLEKGHSQLVINLNINYVDSTGMGKLVQAFKLVRDHGGRMVFVNPGPKARETIKLTRFDQLFSFYDSVEAAVQGLEAGPAPLST